jgi:hypothetical protein
MYLAQKKMVTHTTLAIVAIAAVGLLRLVVVETINIPQQAEARGCDTLSGEHTFGSGTAFNASSGRCFRG